MAKLPPLKKSSNPRFKKPNDQYLFNIKDYEIVRTINKGGFGVVNLVKNKKSNEKFAAKTNLIQNKSTDKLYISREVRILIQIQHPTIIQFRGYSYFDFHGDKNITILMDYMREGSLADLINKEINHNCPPQYTNTKRQIILVGIARGMNILHKHHVIHRDIKPENILLDSDYHPVISDFGLSKFFDPSHSTNQSMTDTGTCQYMAPEVINSDHFNTKADVYSFGILMYEILSGKRAFHDILHGRKKMAIFQFKKRITEGLRPKFDFPIKKGLKKMIEKCWSKNPSERPTFQEIFNKLSLSNDEDILEFEEFSQNQIISDDDEEESNKEDEDDEILEDEIEFTFNKKYCLDDVDFDELLNYVDEVLQEPRTQSLHGTKVISGTNNELLQRENEELKNQIKKMSQKIQSLDEQLSAIQNSNSNNNNNNQSNVSSDDSKNLLSQMKKMEQTIKSQAEEIASIHRKFGSIISVEPNLDKPGILCQLKSRQKDKFDRLFIVSSSNNDLYSILQPSKNNWLTTSNLGDYWIEFEFKEEKLMHGITIHSYNSSFPCYFDITVDGKTVVSIRGQSELCGSYNSHTYYFNDVRAYKVRFIQKGGSSDKGDNFLYFSGFEIVSNAICYPDGVFKKMISTSFRKDPHDIPVHVSASVFDYNHFHDINCSKNIYIDGSGKNEYFQIEFTKGYAVLTGFRLKRTNARTLKQFKLICSDDQNKNIDYWQVLIDVCENFKPDRLMDVFTFEQASPPVRFARLVMTGPTHSGDYKFSFLHLDFFGTYM